MLYFVPVARLFCSNDCNRFRGTAGPAGRKLFSAKLHEFIVKFLNNVRPLALLMLRIALGIIFLYHGYPKLAHAGGGMQGAFVEHGLPAYFVYLAGIIETFGGLLLLLGLFVRGAALVLTVEMCVAIWKFHSQSYLVVHNYEFPLSLAAACFVLATVGAGTLSIDHILFEGGGKARGPRGAKD
jgi:putative oxidoreductase